MACRLCHLEMESTLCEVCRFLTEEVLEIRKQLPAFCEYCGAPIANPAEADGFCQLCGTLIRTVWRNAWFARVQSEWARENIELAKRKRDLIGEDDSPII